MRRKDGFRCPVEMTAHIISGKHKLLILWHLSRNDVLRFGELNRLVNGATRKVLTDQLSELITDGMVVRTAYDEMPPRTEYSLTDKGLSFVPVLESMCAWGEKW